MTHETRGVDVEKYAYYINKLSQNMVWKHNCDVTDSTPNTNESFQIMPLVMTTMCY